MYPERLIASVPGKLKRAFTSHCRRRGLRPNRLIAAIILAYLRQTPHEKLQIITAYHDWRTERVIRTGWKRAESVKADPANCSKF
ncbi:MAG: hypothetical protein WD294_12300 [Phycisphaeraceae bacterium]